VPWGKRNFKDHRGPERGWKKGDFQAQEYGKMFIIQRKSERPQKKGRSQNSPWRLIWGEGSRRKVHRKGVRKGGPQLGKKKRMLEKGTGCG